MKFSVIVPIYKVEQYLSACVDSILQQDYPDYEVILVDDGSPDKCPQICDAYANKDSRVRVIHKENGGLSDARNAGIHAATGDYLMFIDSDDYWSCAQVLSRIARVINETQAQIVQFGRQNYLYQEDRMVPVKERTLTKYNGKYDYKVMQDLVEQGELTISACSIAVSAEFIKKHNGFFTKGIKTEDLEWAIRLYVHNPTWAFCDEHFYIYRKQREGSITQTIDYKHLCDYCWIIESSIERIENEETQCKNALMSYMMYHILICCALSYRVKLTKEQRTNVLTRLRAVSNGRMGKYTIGKKVRMGSFVYRLFGFSVMAKVLGFYLNHRGR